MTDSLHNGFIHESYIKDLSICDRVIELFKNSPNKAEAQVGVTTDGTRGVDKNAKDGIEIQVYGEPAMVEYMAAFKPIVDEYVHKYPASNMYAPWGISEYINIQYYPPGGGFKVWHSERCVADTLQSRRHLVFMTYLNDVTDEGGTEFMHQKVTVSARKGKTLIWPVDWTHTHRGIVSPTQEKYVLTGWFSYMQA